ncbi:hypothetical protein HanPSC8_Chr13g0562711 [Helianthus annuus]|nr:hypothetical protein HanPSC8_Chr13g0562711 [Helianthus annuus]
MMVVTGVYVSRKGWMVVVSNEDDVGGADDTQNRTRNTLRHLKPGNQRLCLFTFDLVVTELMFNCNRGIASNLNMIQI